MQTTIIGFYVYELTHSKLAIACIGLSEVIPAISIALYGGYVTDKSEKRKMLIVLCISALLTSIIVGFATSNQLFPILGVTGILGVGYAMLFVTGILRAFFEPVLFTVFTTSVPPNVYANAGILNNFCWQSASVIAPLTAGYLYAYGAKMISGAAGISVTYGMILLLMTTLTILVTRLKKVYPEGAITENARSSIKSGLRFVFQNKMMLYTMSLDMFSVLFGGVAALLPVYAIDILKTGAQGVGLMRMAMSLGASLTMVALVRFPPVSRPWRNLLITVMGFALSIIGFGLSRSVLASLVFLFAQGAFDSISVTIRTVLMQLLTPAAMRGRVSAINSMFISSSSEIGDLESGIAAQFLGTVPAVLFGGGLTLLIVIITFTKTRRFLSASINDIKINFH